MSISDQPPLSLAAADLHRVPLLELMPTDVRRLVQASFTRVAYTFGEVIVAEGGAADALFVIESGTARVVKVGDDGEEVPLNVLHPGDSFGERALAGPAGRRTATVRASGAVQALRLDRAVFDALVRSEPEVARYVDLHTRRHELRDFLRENTAFADLPADGMRLLLEGLTPLSVNAGETVIGEGDPTGPMYIIRDGRLRAYIDRDGQPEQRAFLRRGDFFGEVSLLRGTDRTASVEAVTACELWALEPELFARLTDEQPTFRERIEQRISQYDYRRVANVPLDFAEELLPADAAGPEVLSVEQTLSAAVEFELLPETDDTADPFARPAKRIRRFPQVLQLDEMDCGAASLATICRYYGRNVSISRVRDAVHTGADGTSLLGIARGAESLGLAARTAKVSKSRLETMPLPAILHWENNHWLVLYDVDAKHARVSDPAVGRRRITRSELESNWSGYAAFFARTEEFDSVPEETSRVRWVLEFFRPYRRALITALVLAIVASAAEMLIPILTRFIVDGVIEYNDPQLLTVLVIAMFGALVLSMLVTLVQQVILSRTAVHVDRVSLDMVSGRLLTLPMSYFNSRRIGDIARRLNGMRQVRQFFAQQGVTGLAAVTQLLAALVVMFVFNWRLAVLYLLTTPLYGLLMWFSQTRLRPTYDVLEEAWGRYQSRQIDSIRGIETVKAMGAEGALSAVQQAPYRSPA